MYQNKESVQKKFKNAVIRASSIKYIYFSKENLDPTII